jgi:hypothetical protein
MLSGCAGALVIAIGVTGGGALPSKTDAIEVLVFNEAGVPSNVLAHAKMEAARIYQPLGLNLTWRNVADEQRRHLFTIKIVAAPSSPELHRRALGVANTSEGLNGRTAYAFYKRIRDFSGMHRVDISAILGGVIAHELGHLLLPSRSHSRSGLMSSAWDGELALRAAKGLLTFSEPESMLIRDGISRTLASSQARLVALRAPRCSKR